MLAPDSPIIEKPLLYSWVTFCAAFVFGLLAHYTLCRGRRKNNAGKSTFMLKMETLPASAFTLRFGLITLAQNQNFTWYHMNLTYDHMNFTCDHIHFT